jgi:hypothetical protein
MILRRRRLAITFSATQNLNSVAAAIDQENFLTFYFPRGLIAPGRVAGSLVFHCEEERS